MTLLIISILAAIGWTLALWWKWKYDAILARTGDELGFA